jgi:hypothetical protein
MERRSGTIVLLRDGENTGRMPALPLRNIVLLYVEICRNNFCLLRAMNEFSLDLA